MVTQPHSIPRAPDVQKKDIRPFKWTSTSIQELAETDCRLDASLYSSDGRQARIDLEKCKWPIVNLCGKGGLADAYHRPRFKRIYVDKSDYPIYQPGQVTELYPKPSAYISDLTRTDIDALRVRKGQVLLTCSGTVGNCTYVRNTLNQRIFSHDLIRIGSEYGGYIYAYLKSKAGFAVITTRNYGAVVSHIEPEHLENIPVPNPPIILKKEIHNLIEESFKLRDSSNKLIDTSQTLLKEALQLPDLGELQSPKKVSGPTSINNFSVPLSQLNYRLDGSYHIPIIQLIESHLRRYAKEVAHVGDKEISQSIILPGRFKRNYVSEDQGVVFIGGKQLYDLDPSNKKFLSPVAHAERIEKELRLCENMTLVTCSGTIGKVSIVPRHWEGWAASQHIIRVKPARKNIAGYLYAWLSSDYAYPLISRFTYGSVVDEINDGHVSKVSVPLLRDGRKQKHINDKILEANRKRAKAYELEQRALKILNRKVIYAR